MATTIGDILEPEEKRKLLLNGIEIPKRVLSNHWDELIDSIVFIDQVPGIEVPYEQQLGRLKKFEADGRVIFQKKDRKEFIIHLDDIVNLRKFVPKKYYRVGE